MNRWTSNQISKLLNQFFSISIAKKNPIKLNKNQPSLIHVTYVKYVTNNTTKITTFIQSTIERNKDDDEFTHSNSYIRDVYVLRHRILYTLYNYIFFIQGKNSNHSTMNF